MQRIMEDFYESIKEKISKMERRNSNCVGAALYIIEEINSDKEVYLSRDDSRKVISKMERTLKPELGCLVLWASGGIPFHAGVVFMEDPFYILHRSKKNGLLTRESLETFEDYMFKNTGLKPVYKIPTKLSKETK